jgi:hypothetical protein
MGRNSSDILAHSLPTQRWRGPAHRGVRPTAKTSAAHEHAADAGRQPTPQPARWAHGHAVFALARRLRRGAGSGPRSTAGFGTLVRLRHMDSEARTRHKGKGPHWQRLDGVGVDEER